MIIVCFFSNKVENCEIESKYYYCSKINNFLLSFCDICKYNQKHLLGLIGDDFDKRFTTITKEKYLNYQILR